MPKKAAEAKTSNGEDEKAYFIVAYVLEIITGIIVLIIKGEEDRRLKLHSMQAIFLGIATIVLALLFGWIPFVGTVILVINILIWLYGLYVGFEAYNGRDVAIPIITEYARRYSGYNKSDSKK